MAEAYEQDCCARAGLVTVDALATMLDDVPYANGAAQQCRAGNAALTKPLQVVDAAIRCIQTKYNLLAAPLDAILATIACKDIAHTTLALPSPTSLVPPSPTIKILPWMVRQRARPLG
jgi:hypothetical protein